MWIFVWNKHHHEELFGTFDFSLLEMLGNIVHAMLLVVWRNGLGWNIQHAFGVGLIKILDLGTDRIQIIFEGYHASYGRRVLKTDL